ncbi:MAG: ABC transporter substrate-binding protein [Proteobacteria bacterium]|nr:MAG: ABC transporter substrate-binding protein [Pseudomonadota bacterium]
MKYVAMMLALLCSSVGFAADGPKEVVQDIFARAGDAAVATDAMKQREVNVHVDYETLANDALGKNAKTIPAAEKEWFKETLMEIISRTVYPKAPEFLAGVKINYAKVEEKGNKATVASTVQNKADVTDVSYKLGKTNDVWKVTDVSISGLSWVESIRDQVSDTIKKKKWKGLKDLMNKRLNTLKNGKA